MSTTARGGIPKDTYERGHESQMVKIQRRQRIPVPVPESQAEVRRSGLRLYFARTHRTKATLFQLIGDFVDPCFHACFILLTARRAGCARRADDLVADFDRQRTLIGDHVGEVDKAQ